MPRFSSLFFDMITATGLVLRQSYSLYRFSSLFFDMITATAKTTNYKCNEWRFSSLFFDMITATGIIDVRDTTLKFQ